MSRKSARINNIVVISDMHCGCQLGLCPDEVALDGGGTYHSSKLQKVVYGWWQEFWNDHVPKATRGEPFIVVNNGDALEGCHHGSTTQISHNLKDQRAIARELLEPVVKACKGFYWHVRGTEAHVGPSAEHEEELARSLGALRLDGQASQQEVNIELGNHSINFMHHISTSTSPFARTGALQREITNHYVEVGKWGDAPYSMLVRGHRHTHDEISHRSNRGKVTVVTMPAWQLKGSYVYKIGSRMTQPEIGGLVIRLADDELFTRPFVKRIQPPKVVSV